MAKISVIMGIYNARSKPILEKSLKSILNQTYKNFELIICDDGSTNGCMQWAKDICDGDNRVKFIKNDKNMGLAYTLNHCLKEAKGEFIARMDDDDESDLSRFQKQIDILEKNENIDLVGSNMNLIDENSNIWGTKKYPENVTKYDFLFNSPIGHPTIMATREAYDKVNGYRAIPRTLRVEDYDCFMRMFYVGVKMYNIQENIFNYREDLYNFKKRKYKYRVNEAWVRLHGFKKLGLLKNPINYLYVIKPLIVGLIPRKLINKKGRY